MIYIQIYEQKLMLINLNGINTSSSGEYNIGQLDFNDGVIFNKYAFINPIKQFLVQNRLSKPKAIINIPTIEYKDDLPKYLLALQLALILPKSDIKIEKILNNLSSTL